MRYFIVIIYLYATITSTENFNTADEPIDLLAYTYEYQYKELIRRVSKQPEADVLMNLIFSVNSTFDKYTVIAPQLKMYNYDIANQYLVVVNLMEQIIERQTNRKGNIDGDGI